MKEMKSMDTVAFFQLLYSFNQRMDAQIEALNKNGKGKA